MYSEFHEMSRLPFIVCCYFVQERIKGLYPLMKRHDKKIGVGHAFLLHWDRNAWPTPKNVWAEWEAK